MSANNYSEAVSIKQGGRCNQPIPLLTMTTEYVACHLIYVETFTTVPEIIGQSIFEAALKLKQFESPSSSFCLEHFTIAYKQLVLETLTLKYTQGLILNRHLQKVKLFNHLKQLDLTGCDIDDYHEVLIHVGTGLHLLEVLLLADNKLSDIGIQRLTACSRVMTTKGLRNLTSLDLSGNQRITNKVFSYLRPFSWLVTLTLTGCNIKKSGKQLLYSQMGFVACNKSDDATVINKGWASPLIDNWNHDARIKQLPSSGSSAAVKFYAKKGQPSTQTQNEPKSEIPLTFIRPDGYTESTSDACPSFPLNFNNSKNPAGVNNDVRSLTERSSSKTILSRKMRCPLLEGSHARCDEMLLATYRENASKRQKTIDVSDISCKTVQFDDKEKKCKVVRDQKRRNSNAGKSKRKKIKVVDREVDIWMEEPDTFVVSRGNGNNSKDKESKDVTIDDQRKGSIFDYLD